MQRNNLQPHPCPTYSLKPNHHAVEASAKAQKKLRKLQGIASQAEQAHAGIIVDDQLLLQESATGDNSNEDCDAGDGEGRGSAAECSSSKVAAGGSSLDRRKRGPGAADAGLSQGG